jgi:hypothetical protein
VVSEGNPIYLKPLGGDKSSTLVKLEIEGEGIAFLEDPFAPFVLTPSLFSVQGYVLAMLAEVLPKQTTPPPFQLGKTKQQIFTINAVDAQAKTVTITPDRAVEAFDPDSFAVHQH